MALAQAGSPYISGAGIVQVSGGSTPAVPVPQPNCGLSSCTVCTGAVGCGWCAMTGSCVVGDGSGPAMGSGLTPASCPVYYSPLPPATVCPADCSTLSTCDSCVNRPDCAFCEARGTCVAQYETAGAVCSSTWLDALVQCPSFRCPSYSSCTACTLDSACGYCVVTRKCVRGNSFGPVGGGTCASNTYVYGTCAGSCGQYSSCLTCGAAPVKCGWCSGLGQCVRASADGSSPASGVCSAGWVDAAASCPATPAHICAAQSTGCDVCLSHAQGCQWCAVGQGQCALAGSQTCAGAAPTTYCIDQCPTTTLFQKTSGSFGLGSAAVRGSSVLHTYNPQALCRYMISPQGVDSGTITITATILAIDLSVKDRLSFYDSTSQAVRACVCFVECAPCLLLCAGVSAGNILRRLGSGRCSLDCVIHRDHGCGAGWRRNRRKDAAADWLPFAVYG